MPCLRIFLGLFLALTVAVGAAGASPAIQPDLLTVSGRQALPRADGTNLEGRLRVVDITIDPNSPRETIGWPSDLQLTLAQAINKSFLNFGYRAESPSNNSISLSLEVAPVDLHVDATGALAEATLRFHQTPGDPHDACFPYDAKGRFRALAREQSGDGQRVLGVAAAVGLALVGVNGGVLLSTEFQTAGSDNSARNARRPMTAEEGVAPAPGRQATLRYAAINAMQLAIADLIDHLGQRGGCNTSKQANR